MKPPESQQNHPKQSQVKRLLETLPEANGGGAYFGNEREGFPDSAMI